MEVFFQILSILCIAVTIIALTERKRWWIRMFDFPRLQILVLQIIAMAGLLLLPGRLSPTNAVLALLTFASAVVQLFYIFPYLPIAKKAVPGTDTDNGEKISLLIANVRMENREGNKLVNLINQHSPDIFLAVEPDTWWEKALQPATSAYPYHITYPLDNTYGMLLYSKLPLKDGRVEFLIKKDIPSIHAKVILENTVINLVCLHPEPPAPEEADSSQPRDRELLVMARKIKDDPSPYIVIGDFNDVAWSRTSYKFERLSRLSDPRRGRGFYNTFHAKIPVFRWALDHVFISTHFRLTSLKRLPNIGSDHFPVYIVCMI